MKSSRFPRRVAAVGGLVLGLPCSLLALQTTAPGSLPPAGSEGGPSRDLAPPDEDRWLAGREVFAREWQERDGLGAPGFNAPSCGFCHKEPALGGAGGSEVDVLSPRGTDHYDLSSVPGNRLAHMKQLKEVFVRGAEKLPQNQGVGLATFFDARQTPSLLGLGRIDSIPEDEILKNEDPEDRDGDGVRGVASRVVVAGTTEIGRFGWKGEAPRLRDFVCRALGGETGITIPDQRRGFGLLSDQDAAADPEISAEELDDLDFFIARLAFPARGDQGDQPRVLRGEQLFDWTGCATCHVPVLYSSDGPVRLYSDLLLHEVLPEVDPATPKRLTAHFTAVVQVRENQQGKNTPAKDQRQLFRTPPLWGIGKTAPYLHDSRSKTLEEAILAHDGEAAKSRTDFENLADQDRQALLAFLGDL